MTKMLSASGGLCPLGPLTTAYDPLEKNPVGAPVGQLYYTVWSKSAVGNADCSFKKYIYCVIYYNFWHTFVPYSRL